MIHPRSIGDLVGIAFKCAFVGARSDKSDGPAVAVPRGIMTTTVENAQGRGAVGWLVKAAAVGLALAFSAGMALAFELALDSTLLGG